MGTIFNIQPTPTFVCPVEIAVPGSPDATLEIEFRRKTLNEITEFLKAKKGQTDESAVMEIVAGWKNCDTEFSPEAIKALLQNYPMAAERILSEYLFQNLRKRLGN